MSSLPTIIQLQIRAEWWDTRCFFFSRSSGLPLFLLLVRSSLAAVCQHLSLCSANPKASKLVSLHLALSMLHEMWICVLIFSRCVQLSLSRWMCEWIIHQLSQVTVFLANEQLSLPVSRLAFQYLRGEWLQFVVAGVPKFYLFVSFVSNMAAFSILSNSNPEVPSSSSLLQGNSLDCLSELQHRNAALCNVSQTLLLLVWQSHLFLHEDTYLNTCDIRDSLCNQMLIYNLSVNVMNKVLNHSVKPCWNITTNYLIKFY